MPDPEKAAADPRIASKSRFARLINVSPSRITDYIAEGKIGPDALEGVGRSARIIVAKAKVQLGIRIDSGQRTGNGLGTRLAAGQADEGGASDAAESDELDIGLKREKLVQLERANRKGAEEEAARQGRYVDAAAARAEMTKIAARVIRVFEGAIPEIAADVAVACSVPERDVVDALLKAFRRVRAAEADRARTAAEALPKLVFPEAAPDAAEPEV